MGLAGPTLIAVDQIDGVIAAGEGRNKSDFDGGMNFTALLSGGLLDLARITNRGMLVVTCLLSSWEVIKSERLNALQQSFSPPVPLRVMQRSDFVRELIAGRLAPAYVRAGITPSSPTWPFTDAAILSASVGMTPRTILMRCDEHRKRCLAEGKVVPCETLSGDTPPIDEDRESAHQGFDAKFVAAAAAADLDGLPDPNDDARLGGLLRDAFDLYARQIPPHERYDVVSKADPAQKAPPLHGRLTFTFHDEKDREDHYCFRAIEQTVAISYSARLKAAITASGIANSIPGRTLLIVRRGPVPGGPKTKTQQLHASFLAAGGKVIDPTDEDLKSFVALRALRDAALASGDLADFEAWLTRKQPLCGAAFFRAAGLCPPPGLQPQVKPDPPSAIIGTGAAPINNGKDPGAVRPPRQEKVAPATIPIGRRMADGEPVDLATNLLPRHSAIIAGAGSGKTVLLRRIVEEAALAGIPAIVIDPNNDLSRLGDAWPERPAGFTDADAAKAKRYRESVEVVVWTPGILAGNPLFLSALPDFAAMGDDPYELSQAVDMAVATLGPLAGARTTLA
jgi:hypothetical protein